MSSGFLFCFFVLRSGPACAAPDLGRGINLPVPFFSFNAQVQLWDCISFSFASICHLKVEPCCDSKPPCRNSWLFFFFPPPQDSRDCESLMKRKNFVPRDRSANTLCFVPLKQGQRFPRQCFYVICQPSPHRLKQMRAALIKPPRTL